MARSVATAAKVGASPPLAAVLVEFDDERLTRLLEFRPDLADPVPVDFAALATRAAGWKSVYACYRGLDRWCHQVAEALCLLRRRPTVADVVALLGPEAGAADVEAALGYLADRALLVRHHDAIELLSAFEELPAPAGLGPPAEALLTTRTSAELTAVARRLGARPATTKAATLEAVVAALRDPARVQAVIDGGPPGTAALVRDVVEQGPAVFVSGGLYGSAIHDRTPVGWLLNRGMLGTVSWNMAVMPAEAGLAVRGGRPFPRLANRPPALPPSPVGREAVDRAAAQAALRLVADVITVLDSWGTAPPSLLKAGGLGIRDVRRASKATGRSEVEAARIIDLAAAAGLAEVDVASDAALPTAAYDDWRELEPARRWAGLAAAWLASPLHLGLAGATSTKDKPISPLLSRLPEPEAVRRRQVVLEVLGGMEPGAGTDAGHLRARLSWQAPLLWSGGPASPSMLIDWVVEEAHLVGLCAQDALSTHGRLASAGRLDEAVTALAEHAPPVSSGFVIQADLTVVAPGELAPAVRSELERLAEVESRGSATVYRLSESSLRRGFEAGRTADDILTFLCHHATRAVPQSLTYLVHDLGRRFGQVRVGPTRCYVRSDDPSLLAEVARSRRTARLGLRLLAPTVAITEAEPASVLSVLRDAGYLPAHEGADGALVVARPSARRAPRRRPPTHAGPSEGVPLGPSGQVPAPDPRHLAAVVAGLRKAHAPPPSYSKARPAAPAAPVRPAPARVPPPVPTPQLGIFDDEPRPMAIAKGRDEVELLLAQAFVEDWVVRLAYTNRKGRSSQLTVVMLGDPSDEVIVACLPASTTRTLVLDRIEWARVLTEAEEEVVFQ